MTKLSYPNKVSPDAVSYFFHHVFLPPRIPQGDDYDSENEILLLDEVIHALEDFSSRYSAVTSTALHPLITMITRLKIIIESNGSIDEAQLGQAVDDLDKNGGFLPIHVKRQNAGILLSRGENGVQLECFELSPRNQPVMSTVGRLIRTFPGPGLVVDPGKFNRPDFREAIVHTITRMSHQHVPGLKPKIKKAKQKHDEDRDTTHPKMVTEFLMATLRPVSTDISAAQIQKNTREEVMWCDSFSPWRRSALWLLVRVSLQLVFRRLSDGFGLEDLYKQFMVFFMSSIIDRSSNKASSEMLFLMSAKVTRRLLKLELPDEPIWFAPVQSILERTSETTQNWWKQVMRERRHELDLPLLSKLNFEQDSQCALPDLDRYLDQISQRIDNCPRGKGFQPASKLHRYLPDELPVCLGSSSTKYQVHNLAALEEWVAIYLNDWTELHLEEEATCRELGELMTQYYQVASSLYANNPEAISIMLLTLLELWIACDKSACHFHSFLDEYEAHIPIGCFQSLLLPFQSQMERLGLAEGYLRRREEKVRIRGTATPGNYRRKCKPREGAKKTELHDKQQQYRRLMQLFDEKECQYVDVILDRHFGFKESRHSHTCSRHACKKQAESITISSHEWPLPIDPLQAKSTVFELRVPQPFRSWRETTLFFLRDCLGVDYVVNEKPRAEHRLNSYSGLSSFFENQGPCARIGLLSQIKPHQRTHRHSRHIVGVTESEICLNNGLHFQYFDNTAGSFVGTFKPTLRAAIACTYQLPQPSAALQQFLFRPSEEPDGPSPNTVIATQSSAPLEMSLEEYKALATMPLGVEIQWQNILVELCTPSVDMKKTETAFFVLQIINQAGPPRLGTHLRRGHSIMSDDIFTTALLSRINDMYERIKENWEMIHGMNVLVHLVLRGFALSPSEEIRAMSLGCLKVLRKTLFHWVEIVKTKASEAIDVHHKSHLIGRSVHIALVCAKTFNIESLPQVFASSMDIAIFLQCSTIVCNGRGSLLTKPGSVAHMLLHSWEVLSYRSYAILADCIVQGQNPGMDWAMQKAWAAYHPGAQWSKASDEADYWLFCKFAAQSTPDTEVLVHYNLLNGELLVDGFPLARLPSDYESNEIYHTLFGKSQLEVMPSHLPGMQFSCQRQYLNHTVHLGKEPVPGSSNCELVVKAVRDSRVWEFVPPRLLDGLFPDSFVEDYAHWYAVEDGYVEFRPIKNPWLSSNQNWRLHKSHPATTWQLARHGTLLVSNRSRTAKVISRIFQPVEQASKLHCILHNASKSLSVALLRFQLEFTLPPGSSDLQSRQHPGMLIDNDQSLDSLFGLQNKLLLIEPQSKDRVLLIPEGGVSWSKEDGHVRVAISSQPEAKLHAYPIDTQLGRFMDNGSLKSKLYLAYLHALTSSFLPDPLTGRTGTEQALVMLRSASVRSFDQLRSGESALLKYIASLTPERRFYPANERVMQSVRWQSDLGCLSHHHGFREEVAAILEQERRTRFLFPSAEPTNCAIPHVEPTLSLRDRIRTASFRVSGFGAEDHSPKYDCAYLSLDADRRSTASSRSFSISKMLCDDSAHISDLGADERVLRLWKFLSLPHGIQGPGADIDVAQLRYDSKWLQDAEDFLANKWCALHKLSSSRGDMYNKFQLMMWLSSIAFSGKLEIIVLETIASIFVNADLYSLSLPTQVVFRPTEGYTLDRQVILARIQSAQREHPPELGILPERSETHQAFTSRRKKLLKQNRTSVRERILSHFLREWPTRAPLHPTSIITPRLDDYYNLHQATAGIFEIFNIWRDNQELRQYLTDLTNSLCDQQIQHVEMPPYPLPKPSQSFTSNRGFICLDDCLNRPPSFGIEEPQLNESISISSESTEPSSALLDLVDSLDVEAKSTYEKWYVSQLRSSVGALQKVKKVGHVDLVATELQKVVEKYLCACQEYSREIYSSLIAQLCSSRGNTDFPTRNDTFRGQVITIAFASRQFPRLSPTVLLEQLSQKRWSCLDMDWKRAFIIHGRSIMALQRAKRLANLLYNPTGLVKELGNPGHTNWDPLQFPDTLLLEIENGILIRDVQESIAQIMRNPVSGRNAVMQLNMGEGKSSVVIPIVAADVANGSYLARVLAAKPQSRQMLQMLVAKLGGLLDRRVYHMPISRSLKLGENEAEEIERMCNECMSHGGVLLVQPEHILSLKLMCLECFIAGKETVGRSLLRVLDLFRKFSRDIVDESDENFNVKFELIYTMGDQRPIEHSPHRWMIIQELLDLAQRYARLVQVEHPHSIEVNENQNGGFPRIRLLDDDGERALLEHIQKSQLMKPMPWNVMTQEVSGGDSTSSSLLLLRGLLAGGVLAFCLGRKRWRVNYGPHVNRDPPTRLCVPYRAKDSPSLRSEFSHPDVVILLTCLNYYYSGLTNDDLFLSFDHLAKSDQADAEYQAWVDGAPKLQPAYHQLVGVNLDDRPHCVSQVFPALRFSKAAIDYFLSHVVFPREMREFPHKLSASGWDIGEIKTNPTVGFSGTNDSRKTLPLTVHQLDFPQQNHTNALVLEYLLRDENSVTYIPLPNASVQTNAHALLDLVSTLDPPAQVILDVGAQILELDNRGVAEYWLSKQPIEGPIQAVVFVNDDDDICVLDQSGRVEPLQISPFIRRMEACFVFLDEAHTRGIDLALPTKYRAAVTLGPGIMKDKLVQACMRMRKLGSGQSVVFCVPTEIKLRILALRPKSTTSDIVVSDVLRWAISETWHDIRRSIPLWAVQGRRYNSQMEIWSIRDQGEDADMSSTQAEGFLEIESQTLEERYRPGCQKAFASESKNTGHLSLIRDRCGEFEELDHVSSTLQEEQERELAPEIESERQVQRPSPAMPEAHRIHPHVYSFITTGNLQSPSEGYEPAFHSLRNTSAAAYLDFDDLPMGLLATRDFSTTVETSNSSFMPDTFQRNVRWILTSANPKRRGRGEGMHMVIISPYEANYFMSHIRNSTSVTLHLYAPRQNQSFLPLDKFPLYNVPEVSGITMVPDELRIQLNLFSGQLYFDSYSEYQKVCGSLGVASIITSHGMIVGADGFIKQSNSGTKSNFRRSPLKYFRILMSQIRKDCQEIGRTHMGQIINGRLLFPRDFVGNTTLYRQLSIRTVED
ncbi:hypothetical protein N7494_000622 [Penicillium frequentans]|uniref:ubiquitinyl hydrolase 1 n=1 Tax=Penicillium frequentans TaxID=3151616 RepID=A0AAD6D8K2_9EURO|nr:hypothetical protein N7494_000622 [Penicillium glabrum]